jgi:tetratricopeptide (TPR) repeat protein
MFSHRFSNSQEGLFGAMAIVLLLASGCATTQSNFEREERSKQAKSHFDLGLDHMDNGRFAQGLRDLLIAEHLDPTSPKIQVAVAEAYMHRGKAEEAEAHLLRAVEIYPGYHDARLNLAGLYLMTGRWEEAAVQSRILIDDPIFPGIWRGFTNLAVAQMRMGDIEGARENLELAIEFQPNYWPALLTLGILESDVGRPAEAVSYFERVLQERMIPSARAEANYRMAEALVSLGNREKAVAHLKTAVVQSPEGEWGKKSEEYLKILR